MEDEIFTTMIAKEKGIWPEHLSGYSRFTECLLNEVNNPKNWNKFCETVQAVYNIIQSDAYDSCGEFIIPSSTQISDFIDEENINTISIFFENNDCENQDEYIDVINEYTIRVTSMLLLKTTEALQVLGLPFLNDSYDCLDNRMYFRNYNPYQIIMFGGDLYD